MPSSYFNPTTFEKLANVKFVSLLPITPILLNILQFIGPAVLTNDAVEEIKNTHSGLIFLQFIASYMAQGMVNTGYQDACADIDNLLAIGAVLSDQANNALHSILSQSIFLSDVQYNVSVRFRDLGCCSKITVAINEKVYAQRQVVDVNVLPGLHCIALREIKGEIYLIYTDGLHLTGQGRQIALKKFLKSQRKSQDVVLPILPHCWKAFEFKKSDSGQFRLLEQIWLVTFHYGLIFGSPRERKDSFLDTLSALLYGEKAKYLPLIDEKKYQNALLNAKRSNCISQLHYYAKRIMPFLITISLVAVMGLFSILYKEVTKLKINDPEGSQEYSCANQTDLMKNMSYFCGNVFFQYQSAWKTLAGNQNNTVFGYLDDAGYLKTFSGIAIVLAIFGIVMSVVIACYIKKPFLIFTWPEKYIQQMLYELSNTNNNGIERTDFYPEIHTVQAVNPLQKKVIESSPRVIVSGLWKRRYKLPDSDTAVITMTSHSEPFDFESAITVHSPTA